MSDATSIFEAERPRLIALCYRMLGEKTAAEDAVQDTWLRWMAQDFERIDNPAAWLRRAAANISIDCLRSARARRETYFGPWLPEPLIETADATVEDDFALAQECELALLWAMERLGPTERVAFILREAFDAGYDEIASVLGKNEAACRQIVSRAHKRVQESGPRFNAPRAETADLINRFFAAAVAQDFETAMSLLAPNAIAITDGGRKARAARRPLIGPEDILQVFFTVTRHATRETDWSMEPVLANGAPAILRKVDGRLDSITTLAADEAGRIAWLYVMRNPDKLRWRTTLHS